MYGTYLRREIAGRARQTVIVATGFAVAIALVVVVTALSAGVREAQARALEALYGIGTDLTVTGEATEPDAGGGVRFEFGAEEGAGSDGTTTLARSRLLVDPFRATLDAAAADEVAEVTQVEATASALSLTNTTFEGEIPDPSSLPGSGDQLAPPGGGSAFDISTFSVLGLEPGIHDVGPMSAVSVVDGRLLSTSDEGQNRAVLDESYATANALAVGDSLDVGGEAFTVIGIVGSATGDADTAADVYLPLDVAQRLAGAEDAVSTVYVQAASSDDLEAVAGAITEALPDATVSSSSDLAAEVSGSLAGASGLVTTVSLWLSIVVLAVALVLAVLFTLSGITRRTREFGTLKAIGWSNRRLLGQVTGESLVQGLLGGLAGLAIGLAGIAVVNLLRPTISASSGAPETNGPPGLPLLSDPAATATEIVLTAPVTPWVLAVALAIALAGGALSAAAGGWRAARLSPAEALRSVG